MSDRRFTCPHCKATYLVHTYSIGMSELIEMRCTSCPAVVGVNVYSAAPLHAWPLRILTSMPFVLLLPLLQFVGFKLDPYTPGFYERLSRRLSPCECGGTLRHDVPHRCPSCLEALPINEIERQLSGVSGMYTTRFREV
jgi:predicted Zn finger-like uncharacterized protein